MELSKEYHRVVLMGRVAMTRAIAEYAPDPEIARQLEMVAVCGSFADDVSRSAARELMVDLVNRQLEQSGYRLVKTPRS